MPDGVVQGLDDDEDGPREGEQRLQLGAWRGDASEWGDPHLPEHQPRGDEFSLL